MVSPSFFDKQRNLAILIDAENVPTSVLGRMLDRVSLYGVPMIRHAYGDLTKLSKKSIDAYTKHGVRLIQQTTYVSGKNASDIRLVIDAMDILHAGKMQAFCIVSSDSDFTGLCNRLRESGMFVMGMGQSAITHHALKQACNHFIYIDDLIEERDRDARLLTLLEPDDLPDTDIHLLPVSNPVAELRQIQATHDLKYLLSQAYSLALEHHSDNAMWVDLSKLGTAIKQLQPDFKPQDHGHSKLLRIMQTYTHLVAVRKKNNNQSGYEVMLKEFDTARYKSDLQHLIANAYKQCLDEGWVNLSALGNCIQQINTHFDYRDYGYSKLSTLINDQPYMEMTTHAGNGTGYLVRFMTE